MLPKRNRLTKKECDLLLKQKSRFFHTASLFARAVKSNDFKMAVAVSKKVFRKAVARNKIRRVIYNSFSGAKSEDLSIHLLVSVKKEAKEMEIKQLQQELDELKNKLKSYFLETTP